MSIQCIDTVLFNQLLLNELLIMILYDAKLHKIATCSYKKKIDIDSIAKRSNVDFLRVHSACIVLHVTFRKRLQRVSILLLQYNRQA